MADPYVGRTKINKTTGERSMWDGKQFVPVAANGKPMAGGGYTEDKLEESRFNDLTQASGAALQAQPMVEQMRGLIRNPENIMGGAGPATEWIDRLTPGLFSKQANFADEMKGTAAGLAIPLASVLKPVANQELKMVLGTISEKGTSKDAANANLTRITRANNSAVWKAAKAREWRQAYGSLQTNADRGRTGLNAWPGESFDQYFARWQQENDSALRNPQGAYAKRVTREQKYGQQKPGANPFSNLSNDEFLARRPR